MQRFQRGLIRIVKGPTGGFLASLGIAAILGGVALASPAPPIAAVGSHPMVVVAAAPLGADGSGTATAPSVASGGVRTEDDPSGRGPAVPGTGGSGSADGSASHVEGPPAGGPGGPPAGSGPSGGTRSAGPSPAHGGARDDPPSSQAPAHDGHHGGGSGSNGNDGNGASEHDQKPDTGPGTNPNGHDHDGGKGGDIGSGGTGDKGSSGTGSGSTSH
jgi:hypothetical protein